MRQKVLLSLSTEHSIFSFSIMWLVFSYLYYLCWHKLLAIVYLFPIAAVTNKHTSGDLKQHKFIILKFWKSQVWTGSCWAKIKGLPGLPSFWKLWGGIYFLVFFISNFCILWFVTPFPVFKNNSVVSSHFFLPPSANNTLKDAWDYIGLTQIIQDNLFILKPAHQQSQLHLLR